MSKTTALLLGLLCATMSGCTSRGREIVHEPPPPTAPPLHQSDRRVVKIYTEVRYTVRQVERRFLRRDRVRDRVVHNIYTGSAVRTSGRLLTARHNLTGPQLSDIEEIDGVKVRSGQSPITGATIRIRVSDESLKPRRLFVHPVWDVAVIELDDGELDILDLMHLSASPEMPTVGGRVSVWGFPGSSIAPQIQQMGPVGPLTITSVEDPYFTINAPVEGGFSGGPVLVGNRCFGIISRAEERHTRALPMDRIREGIRDFRGLHYEDGLPIERLAPSSP